MSISCQVCSLDIACILTRHSLHTLRKTEYHRIDHYSKYSKAENYCSLERRSSEVVPIIEDKDKKVFRFVGNYSQW